MTARIQKTKWTSNEDEHLMRMYRRACALKEMADRFGCFEEDCQGRIEFLMSAETAERERDARLESMAAHVREFE